MSSSEPFIRNVELQIGPLTEDQGGGPSSQSLSLFSDGSRTSLRIRFDVTKTILGSPNIATIQIFNLGEKSRNRITSLARVRMSVGWKNTDLSLLINGAVLSAVSEKNDPDIITTISVFDGFGGMTKGIVNQNFSSRQTVKSMVNTIASKMPGVEIGNIEIDESKKIGKGGMVYSERCADALDELATQYGFSWSIQNGVFQALDDDKALQSFIEISSDKRNLIKASPVLTGPMQLVTGVKIQAILDAAAFPGAQVRLSSSVESQVNGTYKIHQIKYMGDTHENQWSMDMESFKLI